MAKVKKFVEPTNNAVTLFSAQQTNLSERIKFDADMISLTDLWRESGADPQKTPAKWQESEPVKRFIQTACRFLNIGISDIIKTKRGKSGGTYAHPQVALEYAQYLDPKLAVAVNELYFQRVEEEKNPDLLIDRYQKAYHKRGKSDAWIGQRAKGRIARNSFTSCLAAHGVEREGFRNCTNAVYGDLFGGSTDVVRHKLGIEKGDNVRDHMSEIQLMAVALTEKLAEQTIEKHDVRGNARCEMVCATASKNIAGAIVATKATHL